MIVFKVLDGEGRSPYQRFAWPVPKDRPTKWLRLLDGERPVLCRSGFHGFLTMEKAQASGGDFIYEMEIEGEIVTDHEKAAAQRARLTRLAWSRATAPKEIVERGVRACRKCQKPHNSYKDPMRPRLAPQWGDPDDGHSYDAESWGEYIARAGTLTKTIEAQRAAQQDARKHQPATGTYDPVVPAHHAFKRWSADAPRKAPAPGLCGTCGLTRDLHQGWRERAKVSDEFQSYDRWELIEVIRMMRLAGRA